MTVMCISRVTVPYGCFLVNILANSVGGLVAQ